MKIERGERAYLLGNLPFTPTVDFRLIWLIQTQQMLQLIVIPHNPRLIEGSACILLLKYSFSSNFFELASVIYLQFKRTIDYFDRVIDYFDRVIDYTWKMFIKFRYKRPQKPVT